MAHRAAFDVLLVDAVPTTLTLLERVRVWWSGGWSQGRPGYVSWTDEHVHVEEREYLDHARHRRWRVTEELKVPLADVRLLSWDQVSGMIFATLGMPDGQRVRLVLDNPHRIQVGRRLREDLDASS